jgi:hypothetical protein
VMGHGCCLSIGVGWAVPTRRCTWTRLREIVVGTAHPTQLLAQPAFQQRCRSQRSLWRRAITAWAARSPGSSMTPLDCSRSQQSRHGRQGRRCRRRRS